jgi:diguanylate cyclase (GGDEF)-like protein/PAS domain S-box-containing protein
VLDPGTAHSRAAGIVADALPPPVDILEALIRASPLAIIALDRQGRVTLWNPAAERISGWSAAEVLGRAYPIVPSDRSAEHRALLERAARGEALTGIEVRRQRKDGSLVDLSVFSAPLRDAGEAVIGTVAILADVTERKQAEEMRRRLAAIVESSDDAICEITLDGEILSWNAGAERLYGYTAEEALGRPIFVLGTRAAAADLRRTLQRLRDGEAVSHFETSAIRHDGARVDVSVAISLIRDASGRPAGASVVARDITARKRTDKALFFLARLATEFTALLSLSELLEHILRVLHEEAGFDSCTLAMVDHANPDVLILRAASGLRRSFRNLVVPRGQGLHGAVLASGQPLLVPDMDADPRVFKRDPQIKSGIYAPLTVRDRHIGVLSAHRGVVRGFTAADLNLLTVVARYLAGAVEVARLHEEIRDLAATDALTGLANRRAFLDRAAAELSRCRRTRRPLSIALLDLDKFKEVNDCYGHVAGDHVLGRVAAALRGVRRASDLAARFGGDEFVLMLPETTQARARQVLGRLRQLRAPLPEPEAEEVALSYCWGLATFPDDGRDLERLIQTADARLYEMKRGLT